MSIIRLYLILVVGLILTAFLTLLERQLLGLGQLRVGPRKVGPEGIIQPFADALKLLTKQAIIPYKVRLGGFVIAPIFAIILSVTG